MTAIRSQQLGANVAVVSRVLLYTVPTGKRTIVKSLLAQNLASAAIRVVFDFAAGSTIYGYFCMHPAAALSSGETVYQDTWIVLEPGDTIHATGASTGAAVVVSGAELTL